MAQGIRYVCNNCLSAIEAWSDGNPYYIDENGQKEYAYHPSEKLSLCIGNDSPHLCLSCGEKFNVDSLVPTEKCPKCGVEDIVSDYEVGGTHCPYCKTGIFERDSKFCVIS